MEKEIYKSTLEMGESTARFHPTSKECGISRSHLLITGVIIGVLISSSTVNFNLKNVNASTVSGHIGVDTVWNLTNSPYIIDGDIMVDEGVTLEIESGVECRFDGFYGIYIEGSLIVNGISSAVVVFTSNEISPSKKDWSGIYFNDASDDSRCRIEYSQISYGAYGIYCNQSSPAITNNTISSGLYYGIYCSSSSFPKIINNTISDVEYGGIYCSVDSMPSIIGNKISRTKYGIISYSNPTITQNTFSNNYFGIYCWESSSTIVNNSFSSNWDSIFCFYSSPTIHSNIINSSKGSGINCFFSSPTICNNRLDNNTVGLNIPYNSKSTIPKLVENSVNDIDAQRCYYLNRKNTIIENWLCDSSHSSGYTGSINAQGLITLYDCANITIKECNLSYNDHGIYSSNSHSMIINTTISNNMQYDFSFESNSTIVGMNLLFNHSKVNFEDDESKMTLKNYLHVFAEDVSHKPIVGAEVEVKENHEVVYERATGIDGVVKWMIVTNKIMDKITNEIGAFEIPIQITVSYPPVSFKTFSEPMNRSSVEDAINIHGNLTPINIRWSNENKTITFLIPTHLDHNTEYTILIDKEAKDLAGNSLQSELQFSFKTEVNEQNPFALTSLIGAIALLLLICITVGIIIWKRRGTRR
jgi:parallel beta-helix repeat protein